MVGLDSSVEYGSDGAVPPRGGRYRARPFPLGEWGWWHPSPPLCPPPASSCTLPRRRVSRLVSEKRELEAQLDRSREEALAGRAARQEAEALRGLVRGLELELRQERGLGHRTLGRRGQDCRRLTKEVRGRSGAAGGSRPRGADLGLSERFCPFPPRS